MNRETARSGLVLLGTCALLTAHAAGGTFELDGNAGQDGAAPPEDWGLLYDGGNNTGGSSVAFTGIFADPGQTTIYGGGSKDIQDITRWKWKSSGGFPDKNDITNAYAAAYSVDGDLVIYFGADRFSNTGDAYLGFWFFKDRVTLNPDGSFNGAHQVGDILVLVNYPQGATALPEIQVIEWNPALADVADNLRLLFSGSAALCGDVPPDPACAITNLASRPSPWPYLSKDGAADVFPEESFFEGGINLTEILGGAACFTSFLAETRSSTSISATLKDFVIGEFPVCDVAVEKQCAVTRLTDSADPTDRLFEVAFDGAVVNSGAGTFPAGSLVTVVDDAGTPTDASDDVVIEELLGSALGPGESFSFSGSFYSNDNPPLNTVSAVVETFDATVVAENYSTECEPLPVNPELQLSKMCWLTLEPVGDLLAVKVGFSGDVENTGDVPLVVTVDDDMAGSVLGATLLLPGEIASFVGSYLPSAANGGVTDPSCATFTDTCTAIGTSTVLDDPIVEMISATCPLCPGSSCP